MVPDEKLTAESAVKDRLAQLELVFNTSIDIMFLIAVEPDGAFRFASINNAFVTATGL